MDVYCPICAEPWDIDSLHEGPGPFKQVYQEFQTLGCIALGAPHNRPSDDDLALVSAEVMALLGDDVDGAASMMEDAIYLGL